tara:strand:- start:14868 stop:15929 length:1062 start_codon:yes stop_codon:yes gene_type:complete
MKKSPSVLHFIDSLEPGGAEVIAITLANIFQERGHNVGLLYFNKTKVNLNNRILSGVELRYYERRNKYNPIVPKDLKVYINKFDVIHIHLRYNLKYYTFLNFFYRFNKPVFFHDHFGNINNDKSIDWFEKLFMKKIVYIGVSNILMNWAKRNRMRRKYLLENIVISEHRQKRDNHVNRIITVGNIHKRKNQLFAIKLLKRILQTRNCSLDIYGKIHDPDYYSLLIEYIQRNKLDNNIKFIFNCTEIQKILHKYSIAFHCATSETGPLVLLEYLVQGLPFLTSNTGHVIDTLKPDLNCFIVNDFSIKNWLDAAQLVQKKSQKELSDKMVNIFHQINSPISYYKKCLRIYTENIP